MNDVTGLPAFNRIESVPGRREDDKLVRGQGRFVADIALQDPLHLAFVRAPMANAIISECGLERAMSLPGVRAAFRGEDVAHLGDLSVNDVIRDFERLPYPVLAQRRACAVGQPVAAILADDEFAALDACERVDLDFEGGDVPTSVDAGADGARVLFSKRWREGDCDKAFRDAGRHVEVEIEFPLLAPSPMENRGVAVEYRSDADAVIVWISTQTPHRARSELARILGVENERIRVISPDVGGAFGMKASLYPEEVLAVWAALRLKRNVRWIASRGEDLVAASHGRGLISKGRLAFDEDGTFLAMTAETRAPIGCWMTSSCQIPAWNAARILPGPYDIRSYDIQTCGVMTHTAPVGIYRGAGRPEAAMLMERLVEKAAKCLNANSLDLRRRNLVPSNRMPLSRKTGVTLDCGDYRGALDRLRANADYRSMVEDVAARRVAGEFVGVGICFFLEPSGTGWESANVRIDTDGRVTVKSGGSSQGQGRETAFAQIAAEALRCDVENVAVLWGDTDVSPQGIGALASRSTPIGGSAVLAASRKALNMAGGRLTPDASVEAEVVYEAEAEAWGYGCYAAQVSVDGDTGSLAVERMFCLDDAGTRVNPQMIDDQVRGGVVQGLGEVIVERVFYAEDGQLLTGSLMDYGLPRAADVPDIVLDHTETPTPANLLGAKGVGEAGAIGAQTAVYNAVVDALDPIGADDLPIPMTCNAIWRTIQGKTTE